MLLNNQTRKALKFITEFTKNKTVVILSFMLTNRAEIKMENTLNLHSQASRNNSSREDFSEYVAHLQLHMALQARNLVPTLTQAVDSREQLLQQTQAEFEKLVSRQML